MYKLFVNIYRVEDKYCECLVVVIGNLFIIKVSQNVFTMIKKYYWKSQRIEELFRSSMGLFNSEHPSSHQGFNARLVSYYSIVTIGDSNRLVIFRDHHPMLLFVVVSPTTWMNLTDRSLSLGLWTVPLAVFLEMYYTDKQ